MTDKELLELAAKAAGIGLDWVPNEYDNTQPPYRTDTVNASWNPLEDDGDALRLAVKLKFNVECLGDATQVNFMDGRHNSRHFNVGKDEGCNGDPYAATRRAIVRAAAEIGKGIK